MNIGIFTGRLTADATFWNGSDPSKNLAKFTVAVTDPWNPEKTDYFQITCFGKKADYVMNGQQKGRFLKGCEAEVSGPIHLGNYKTQQGEERFYISVIAETLYSKVHKNFNSQNGNGGQQGTQNNLPQNPNGNMPVQQNGTPGYNNPVNVPQQPNAPTQQNNRNGSQYNNAPGYNSPQRPNAPAQQFDRSGQVQNPGYGSSQQRSNPSSQQYGGRQNNGGPGYNNQPSSNTPPSQQFNQGQNNGDGQYNRGSYNNRPANNGNNQYGNRNGNAPQQNNGQQFAPNNAPMPSAPPYENIPDSIPEDSGQRQEQEGGFRPATYSY